MKRTLTACAAVSVAAIMAPAIAEAHVATGTVSCTAATIDFTRFPAGPQNASWQLLVDQHVAGSGSFAFAGPNGTFTTPVTIARRSGADAAPELNGKDDHEHYREHGDQGELARRGTRLRRFRQLGHGAGYLLSTSGWSTVATYSSSEISTE